MYAVHFFSNYEQVNKGQIYYYWEGHSSLSSVSLRPVPSQNESFHLLADRPTILAIYGYTAPLLDLRRFFTFLTLYTVGSTP
jgi:hypothetical protein